MPSRGLYPHQWSWDSAFIALGLQHCFPRRGAIEQDLNRVKDQKAALPDDQYYNALEEVLVRLQRDVEQLIKQNPQAFPQTPQKPQ